MTRTQIERYLRNVVGVDLDGSLSWIMGLSDANLVAIVRRFAGERRDGMDDAPGVAYAQK